jgi:dihydrofolate reductase
MNLIAAVDKNWGIGNKGDLLVRIPLDQQMFRKDTLGKICIMGRKTFESLPGGRPLDGRINIVLSSKRDIKQKGVYVCRNKEEVLDLLEKYKQEGYTEDDFFVIGGEEVYRRFLPYCDKAHITMIDYEYVADRHMIDLDADPDWVLAAEGDEESYFDLLFKFVLYVRKGPKEQ